jgi:hypothetical protein
MPKRICKYNRKQREDHVNYLISSWFLFAEGVEFNFTFDFEKVRIKDKDHGLPANSKVNFDVQHMSIHLDNLFNGNKFLGKCGYNKHEK